VGIEIDYWINGCDCFSCYGFGKTNFGAATYKVTEEVEPHYVMKVSKAAAPSGHKHVWPVLNLS